MERGDYKRSETRARIAEAALALAVERGVDKATVRDICLAAGVSTRTFFNYFDSKDDALLNLPWERHAQLLVARLQADAAGLTPVQAAVRFFVDWAGASRDAEPARSQRLALVAQSPRLSRAAFLRLMGGQTVLAPALGETAARAGWADLTGPGWEVLAAAAAAAVGSVLARHPDWRDGAVEEEASRLLCSTVREWPGSGRGASEWTADPGRGS